MDREVIQNNLDNLRRELRQIHENADYYAITLLGTKDNKASWYTYSHWIGWVGDKPSGRELRKASIVNADYITESWQKIGQTYIVVNDLNSMMIFLNLGGNAVIEKAIAHSCIPEILEPNATAPVGPRGFVALSSFPESALKKAPTKKQRMNVLKRDKFRCRICGRTPDNYVDLELHVHHIRPWGEGGLTLDDNLITLCQTCHEGLDPHGQISLFEYLGVGSLLPNREKRNQEYNEGVRFYRDFIKNDYG